MFEKACLIQTLSECGHEFLAVFERSAAQNSDHRQRRLLRARRERQRGRAAESQDELAAPHSITSSARPSNGSGKVRPSVFADGRFRLLTSPNWTGSAPVRKMIGIVAVAALAASPAAMPPGAARTATRRAARSAASIVRRS